MVKIEEPSGLGDYVETVHFKADGTVVSRNHYDLMVVNGLAAVISYLTGLSPSATPFVNIGIGTGATSADKANTQLQTPLVIKLATISKTTTLNANDTMHLVYTFSSADGLTGTTVAVTEVGVFNGVTNGVSVMLLHQVYTPSDVMNWDQGDSLQVTVNVQAKQG